ncbi:putative DCC family thiol-disulfide oxidoreductase YuxK [Algoriphagus sp. 4150]|uniref:DCC1-like thiol-disulfide oxidoreductase family protein n=1 Tax=Algoriphagus sp. 4150 TaxID=2817756 RepID=UPI002863EB43|nr:DCC1-like thiol-disulfide oxidoreductase family protein [Algoriphagus sp. 4150]MDR7130609.1 putative DCC family thiol-disulfide oxidoreductase YuxK [Algoriphagus sp. 4150]
MFTKIQHTQFPPDQPLFLWDGECGFCKYWIIVWKSKTEGLTYTTFQEAASDFPDIPLKEFKKASRLIETDGSVFSGPDSAYRTFYYFRKPKKRWHRLYQKSGFFQKFSDHTYNWIAKNRPLMMNLTKAFWGKNPIRRKPYWMIYLLGLLGIIAILLYLLH